VRALVIGALGLSLIGCSHPLPPQAALVSAAPPTQPMWVKAPDAARDAKPALAPPKPSRAHARARIRLAYLAATPAKPASSLHVPLPPSAPRRPETGDAKDKPVEDKLAEAKPVEAKPADAPRAETKPVPEPKATPRQVTVATAAEQLQLPPALPPTADSNRSGSQDIAQRNDTARNTARTAPAPLDNPDLLVAVLMARPETKSVADLAGKTIAIDERYAKSSGTVRTAIVAAGATAVQLSEGTTTAINRLTNGEVPAAVVALVSPDATETFPDIKGFKIFHVPLSPRAARAR
jgi:hypothetical protein